MLQGLSLKPFGISHTIILYWSTCLLLNSTIRLALCRFPVPDSLISADDLPCYDPDPYANSIASSTEYFFQPDAHTDLPSMFLLPMATTLQYLAYTRKDPAPEHMRLVVGIRSGKIGEYIGRFIRSLQASTDPWEKADRDEDPSTDYVDHKARA